LLLFADDGFVCEAITEALRNGGYSVLQENRNAPVEQVLLDRRPHLVVLDVDVDRLSEQPGAVQRLRVATELPLVLLTSSNRLEDRLAGLEAGADDVLVKPFSLAELVLRVRALLRRSGHREGRLQVGDVMLDEPAHRVERCGVQLDLTATEFSLLTTLCEHKGLVLSKTQLLTRVWGFDHYDVNLVEVHISALRRKLEAVGPRILHTIRGVGYVLRPIESESVSPRLASTPASFDRRNDDVGWLAS
jgi:DNA-binding response OmpR family regulator